MFYNFVMLSGLLLFVFSVDNEVAFCRLLYFTFSFSKKRHTSLFCFRQIMSSLEVSKLSFVKAQLYGLGFANATFYL